MKTTATNEAWEAIGVGVMILLICMGYGGCLWLEKQSGPLVVIKHEQQVEAKK